jgi:propionate CoA-transferase
MVRRVIGGHLGLAPELGRLIVENQVEGCCLPIGVISELFREIGGGRPGIVSRSGWAPSSTRVWRAASSTRERWTIWSSSMEREALTLETLSIAQAAKNSGGVTRSHLQ